MMRIVPEGCSKRLQRWPSLLRHSDSSSGTKVDKDAAVAVGIATLLASESYHHRKYFALAYVVRMRLGWVWQEWQLEFEVEWVQ